MGTILAQDIPGSTLTIAFQNAEQDSATRKFLVTSTGRADAITTVTNALATVNHPDESGLKANRVTAQAVGPARWLVTVQYIRRRIGGIPSGGANLGNMRASSEATEVYCTPDSFDKGLPYGGNGKDFVNPGPNTAGQATDPQNPPRPWIYNRPVLSIAIPFSSATNPITANLELVSKINAEAITIGGVPYPAETLRYDGGEVRSVAPSTGGGTIRYYGTENYTFSLGGWYKQILRWDISEEWKAENRPLYDQAT